MDERGGVGIEKPIGSVLPRMRREKAASKRQRKSYRFNGESEGRKTNQAIRLQGCVRNFPESKKDVRLRD